jgi:hypothetical protein
VARFGAGADTSQNELGAAVADIFQEVDEEVRREKLKQFWERYSLAVIGVCVAIVVAIGAWRGYDWYTARQAAIAGANFESAVSLMGQGKAKEAEAAFNAIAKDAPAGYAALARMRAANALAGGDKPAAIKAYTAMAQDGTLPPAFQDIAAIRAGMLMVDTAPLADLQRLLDPLAGSDRPFRHSARDLLALSAWHHQDVAATKKYLDMMAKDSDTPPGVRARADVLAALIAANGKG